MFQTSRIELSRGALAKNIRFLKKQLQPETVFSSVIKGNAYGHGIECFVPLAERCGVRHFSVFSADEALTAQKHLTKSSEIMIMGAVENEQLKWAIEHDISFFVFGTDRLKAAVRYAKKLKKKARVHLEIETGMHRTGLEERHLKRALKMLDEHGEHLEMVGLCSHLAGAESTANHLRVTHQIARYQELAGLVRQHRNTNHHRRHLACSAAVLTYPQTTLDMVRIGIAQYGYWPSKETELRYLSQKYKGGLNRKLKDPLTRVIRWSTSVMSIKKVRKGDYIGYGSSTIALRSEKLATIPVGYSHGFARHLSNVGHVLIRGQRAPVAGIVNMSMMTVDVTDIPGVQNGDEVVIIGKQGDNTISVGSFGEMSRFLNYEILVRLPSEIPRVIVD